MRSFDKPSLKKLASVKPELQAITHKALELCQVGFAVVAGNRTQAEQDALFAQGRTRKGHIVTWTRHSRHIGGNAIDFAVLDAKGKIDWHDLKAYVVVGRAFKAAAALLGASIEWGGDWKKTPDWGHVQLKRR